MECVIILWVIYLTGELLILFQLYDWSSSAREGWFSLTYRFTVLGRVGVSLDGAEVDLGAQSRAFLAALLIRAGHPVTVGEIVDILWGGRSPASAVNAVHKHASTVRRMLEPDIAPREQGRWLVRRDSGYLFHVAPDDLDLLRFRCLVDDARAAHDQGDSAEAVELYLAALGLWRGRCAENLDQRIRLLPPFYAVDREFITAMQQAVDLALSLGCAERVLPLTRAAAAAEPLDEPLQARLLLVLAATGRQACALSTYQQVRERLADELGVDPGLELRAAHQQVLRHEFTTAVGLPGQPHRPVAQQPAQLPRDVPRFVGRADALARLDAVAPHGGGETTPLVLLTGGPGVGKTALTVHWAQRAARNFPDGQLFVNLWPVDRFEPLDPADVLRHFLSSLGLIPELMPTTTAERSALFRTMLDGRRVLVVLDNAATAEQVRPLLPGSAGSMVLVTSRFRQMGLVALDGARSLEIGTLTPAEVLDLLTALLTEERVSAEPGPAAALGRLCAYHPVALRLAAAHLACAPERSIESYVCELFCTDRWHRCGPESDDATETISAFISRSQPQRLSV